MEQRYLRVNKEVAQLKPSLPNALKRGLLVISDHVEFNTDIKIDQQLKNEVLQDLEPLLLPATSVYNQWAHYRAVQGLFTSFTVYC